MKGTITRRGKSSWRLKFDAPSADGKRNTQYVTVRGGKKDAQAKLNEQLAAIGKGTFVEPSKLALADHIRSRIDLWHSAGEIGPHSFKRYGDILDLHIRPHIGAIAVQRLSTTDVEGWHKKLRDTPLAPRTVRHCHRLLSKALADAVRHKIVTHNVAGREGQRSPKVPNDEVEIIRAGEIEGVVEKLRGTPMFAPAMLALFCGLRAGEICALRWANVDLDKKVIHVRESVEEVHGEPLAVKAPKTKAGIRSITAPDIVIEALRDLRRQQLELRLALGLGKPGDDALVYPAGHGGIKRPSNLSRDWRRADAADLHFHGLRHTHASQLIAAGLDVVLISTRLGHAKPTITLAIYAHLFEKDDAAAAEAINRALGASPVPKRG
ncbi:site-specific integrase [uncultured Reyranella sp.]|uniref:tyrosine-type recombinase/integrase n=1 Tax=uncultured Reyranella sp. TaxID=735512 RepID=UPI0025CE3D92|nr:site-specific integrase [uncultured Reyranella sp.]